MNIEDLLSFTGDILIAFAALTLVLAASELFNKFPELPFPHYRKILLWSIGSVGVIHVTLLFQGYGIPSVIITVLKVFVGVLALGLALASWSILPKLKQYLIDEYSNRSNDSLRKQIKRHNDVGASLEKMVLARTTALEKTKTDLEVKERRYRVMLNSMSQVLLTTDAKGKVVAAQDSWERYTGQQWDEAKGYSLFDVMQFDGYPRASFAWEQILESGEAASLTGRLYSQVHDQHRAVRATIAPVSDKHDILIEWVVAVEDIEDRMKAEQRFQRLLEIAPVSMLVQDINGTILLVNNALEKMFGYEADELIGRSGAILGDNTSPEQHEQHVRAMLSTPKKMIFGDRTDVFAMRKDGSEFPLQATVQSIDWQGQPALLASYIDLSVNRERHVEILEAKNMELETSNRDLEQFAYIASHDLKEPVRKISAFGDMLKEHLGEDLDEDAEQYLQFMLSSAGRMSELIDDLLSYARVSQESSAMRMVDMNPVAEAVINDLGLSDSMAEGAISVGTLPTVFGHEPHLRRVLANLIVNGRKFARSGVPPVIKITGESLGLNESKSASVITVSDNGEGIPADAIQKVFGMFTRLHGRNVEGTGLGLSICRRIMNEQGGSISVTSEVGVGSNFKLHFAAPPAEALESAVN